MYAEFDVLWMGVVLSNLQKNNGFGHWTFIM